MRVRPQPRLLLVELERVTGEVPSRNAVLASATESQLRRRVRRTSTRHVCLQQPRTGLSHAARMRHGPHPLRPGRCVRRDGAQVGFGALGAKRRPMARCGRHQRAWVWSWRSDWSGCFLFWLPTLAVLRAEWAGPPQRWRRHGAAAARGRQRAARRRRAALSLSEESRLCSSRIHPTRSSQGQPVAIRQRKPTCCPGGTNAGRAPWSCTAAPRSPSSHRSPT